MANKASELQLRVVSALVLAVIALSGVWAGGFWFAAIVSIIAFLVFLEWTGIVGLNAFEAKHLQAMATMVLPFLVLAAFGIVPAIFVLTACAAVAFFMATTTTKETALWTAAAVLYCGFAAISLVGLRGAEQGIALILFLFAIVWGTDIGAYFVGRKFGGPKLAPKISPGKTRSGAIGGIMIAVIAASAISIAAGLFGFLTGIVIAALISIVSQIGDLFESYLKRRFGVKDSGSMVPGHGGLFDRVDGLMPAAIVLFLLSSVI